jgi:uncharacterized surface protein with fasciclin (FAS1) repeats
MSMNSRHRYRAIARSFTFTSIGVVGALLTVPATAQVNPNPTIFNEPPFNQGIEPIVIDAPVTTPMEPAESEVMPQEAAPISSEPTPSESTASESTTEFITESTTESTTESMTVEATATEEPSSSSAADLTQTAPVPPANTPVDPTMPGATPDPTLPPLPSQAPGDTPPSVEPVAPVAPIEQPTSEGETSDMGNLVEVATENGSFETLISALKVAGLTDILQNDGPFTIFAPTDEAFAALPEGTLAELLKPENRDLLVKLLSYHVVAGEVTSSELTSGEVMTAEGAPVNVQVSSEGVMVNDATVTQPDVMASNGVIHVVDRVILPPGI